MWTLIWTPTIAHLDPDEDPTLAEHEVTAARRRVLYPRRARASGRMTWAVCARRCAVWVCGCVGLRVLGYVAVWLCGCVGVWVCESRVAGEVSVWRLCRAESLGTRERASRDGFVFSFS